MSVTTILSFVSDHNKLQKYCTWFQKVPWKSLRRPICPGGETQTALQFTQAGKWQHWDQGSTIVPFQLLFFTVPCPSIIHLCCVPLLNDTAHILSHCCYHSYLPCCFQPSYKPLFCTRIKREIKNNLTPSESESKSGFIRHVEGANNKHINIYGSIFNQKV